MGGRRLIRLSFCSARKTVLESGEMAIGADGGLDWEGTAGFVQGDWCRNCDYKKEFYSFSCRSGIWDCYFGRGEHVKLFR